MKYRSLSPGRNGIVRDAIAVLLLGLGASARAQTDSGDCYAACATAGSSPSVCALLGGPELNTSYQRVTACRAKKVAQGAVLLRYRHKGEWFTPPAALAKDAELKTVFEAFRPDACSIPTPACTQQRMATKVAAIGGHGIDGQASKPAGEGDPCSLGLPCGRIVPPATEWRFRLEDTTLQGQWVVRIARGEPPAGVPKEFSLPVVAGAVTANGAQFAPGAVYVYRLSDSAGKTRTSGEFSLLSRPLHEALRGFAAKRVAAGQSEATAWVDSLVANELDWDAYQATLERR